MEDPKPTNASRNYIEKIASEIAEKLGFKPGGDLKKVVRQLGGEVNVRPWHEPEPNGSIHVHKEGKFTINLSPFTGHFRDRFTIAHELGHYFLHSRAGKHEIRIAREGSNLVEWEANWFAAGFLMPEEAFRAQWKKVQGDHAALAAFFDVSPQTVRVRAKGLGLS